MSVKVTESLRRQWALQRAQFIEEREFDQSGRRRSPDAVAEMDAEIAHMDRLLALPVGSEIPKP